MAPRRGGADEHVQAHPGDGTPDMSTYRLERRQVVSRPLEQAFAFYEQPRNLCRITPRWLQFRMVSGEALSMRRGLRIHYRIRPLGVPQRWTSEITEYDPRSEEHTSELQSRENLVCRLLL